MMMDNVECKVYTTADTYRASFLIHRKHKNSFRREGNIIIHVFDMNEALTKDLQEYEAGATIAAVTFTNIIKNLKGHIFALKRENANYGRIRQPDF